MQQIHGQELDQNSSLERLHSKMDTSQEAQQAMRQGNVLQLMSFFQILVVLNLVS